MLKNYLIIILRSIWKQKLSSGINLLGLSTGLSFCILLSLFMMDELSYDQFHQHQEKIFRLYRQPLQAISFINKELYMPMPTGPAMQTTFPEVEQFVRLIPLEGSRLVRHQENTFQQEGIVFADASFFQVFSFPLIAGNPLTALTSPSAIILTKPVAQKYFGKHDPIGEILSVKLNGRFYDLQVTGVTETIPSNSSIQFQILLPLQTLVNISDAYRQDQDRRDATRCITYVKLREKTDAEQVSALMPKFMETYMGGLFDQMRRKGMLKTEGLPMVYQLQPLSDIHFNPDIPAGLTPLSNPIYLYILASIALAVLLIACFNFAILTMGRAAQRAKEAGVRKVIGARKIQLMIQFWGEAFLLSFMAFILGMGIAGALLPLFNELVGKNLSLRSAPESPSIFAILLITFILTGFIAGSYPALVLSAFHPVDSLKEKVSWKGSNAFTKSLIVAQFCISAILIIATLVMVQQMQYIQNKHLGFDEEQVVVISTHELAGDRVLDLYKQALGNHSQILSMTGANVSLGQSMWHRGFLYEGEPQEVAILRVDPAYVSTMKMQLVAGRDFDAQISADSTESILVNEAFVKAFGWQEPVGKILPVVWGSLKNPKVIGVIEDFNFNSLHEAVEPLVIYTNAKDPILHLLIRIRPEEITTTLQQLQNIWEQISSDLPFHYSFLDEDIERLYQSEKRWNEIVGYGGFFSILIACLGLLGLADMVAYRRQKEIGIRKVLGASANGILLLLSKDYMKLIIISLFIAIPITNYFITEWLQSFAYRIEVHWWLFAIPGILILAIALLSVSGQTLKAAKQNPVDSLRYE